MLGRFAAAFQPFSLNLSPEAEDQYFLVTGFDAVAEIVSLVVESRTKMRGIPRIELGTSRTQSENHTTRPNALLLSYTVYLGLGRGHGKSGKQTRKKVVVQAKENKRSRSLEEPSSCLFVIEVRLYRKI